MVDIVTMIVYLYQFQNDTEVIRIARQNSEHLQRIAQANLTDDQLNDIFPVNEYSDCSASEGIKCVNELEGN